MSNSETLLIREYVPYMRDKDVNLIDTAYMLFCKNVYGTNWKDINEKTAEQFKAWLHTEGFK
jgi:hypothetical protein